MNEQKQMAADGGRIGLKASRYDEACFHKTYGWCRFNK